MRRDALAGAVPYLAAAAGWGAELLLKGVPGAASGAVLGASSAVMSRGGPAALPGGLAVLAPLLGEAAARVFSPAAGDLVSGLLCWAGWGLAGLAAAEGRLRRAPAGGARGLSVVLGRKGREPVVLRERDRFLHVLVVGTTGTGKTSRVLKPMIYQDLEAMARGERLGVTVVEPKGDLADSVAAMAREMGLEVVYLNPLDPASPRFNPLEGEEDEVAEIMRTVLTSLFGKQEAFFSNVQQIACRNTVKLLKRLRGNDVTMVHMADALRNPAVLEGYVAELEAREGHSALTGYFRAEVLGKLQDKMQQFALGLRLQVEDLLGNDMLRRLFDGPSGIDLDRHLEGGQVLVVNTAMGALGKLGDVFGQFVVMHLQNAVFRRPGNEWTRVPHCLYIDEFPRYLNPDFERLLAIGRSYRCGVVLALQNTSQLLLTDARQPDAFRNVVLGNCRTKVVLNLDDAEDAGRFARELGEVWVEEESTTVRRVPGLWGWHRDSRTYRRVSRPVFSPTELQNLEPGTGVVRTVRDGCPQPPVKVCFDLAPPDRRPKAERLRKAEWGELEVLVPEVKRGLEVIVPEKKPFLPGGGDGV